MAYRSLWLLGVGGALLGFVLLSDGLGILGLLALVAWLTALGVAGVRLVR